MRPIAVKCAFVVLAVVACSEDPAVKAPTIIESLPSDLATCAKAAASGTLLPAHLVFVIDRSKSMGFSDAAPICDETRPCVEGKCDQEPGSSFGRCADLLDRKWNAAKSALYAFFDDPASAGSTVSLDTFAKAPDDEALTGVSCVKESYFADSAVKRSPLPGSAPLKKVLDAIQPEGFTPTYPATFAAVDFAFKSTPQGERPVVILVTDGEPNQCGDINNASGLASLTKSYLERGVSTFVIGVDMGDSTRGQFDYVAASGGSLRTLPIALGKAEETKERLLTALGRIKDDACSLAIPPPPTGEKLDYDLVNVALGQKTLSYSKDCKAAGWRYDSTTNPTRIDLCPASCAESKKTKAPLNVALGCKTQGDLIL